MVNGWIPTSLGEILRLEKRPVTLNPDAEYAEIGIYSYGRGIFHKRPRTGFEVGDKDLFEIKNGDFIFQITFAWEGAIALASEAEDGMYGSVRFPTYRVNENICDPKFLLQYFKTENGLREVGRISPGSAGRNRVLATKRLPEIYVPLPLLTEQRRIVAHIESLAARVNEAQRLREEADKEAKSLLNSALSKITQDLLANHEPQTLEELTLFIGDMNHEMPKGQDKGIPFVSPKDFIKNDGNIGIDFDGAKKITREDFERLSKKACPQKGDILMARYGTIGAARYVDTDREFLASYSIAIIRPNPELVDGRFLYWMSISPYVQEQAIKGIRGSSMADLGLKTIREFIIPHLNFDEQRRIVAYLDGLQTKVNALRGLQSQSQEELDALLPSVLDRAFKGEL